MKIVIIQYNAGNSTSLLYSLNRLGFDAVISKDKKTIENADKILFPGQGEASSAMRFLKHEGLDIIIQNLTKPLLGICLGMQLLCEFSEEENTKCLNIIKNTIVKKIPNNFKVPQIGWNKLINNKTLLFEDINDNDYVYYANSFAIDKINETISESVYHKKFSAGLNYKNFYGIQFHPEKSGKIGEKILLNFLQKI